MIWSKAEECRPRRELEALQLKRLQKTVRYMYERVPFYRDRCREAGVEPDDIRALSDLAVLPFMVKNDLRLTYPDKLFAVPMREVVEIHASSGTTGRPIVVGYTRNDLNIWGEVMARTLSAGGANASSVVQVSYGYGLFTGGFGAHYGAQTIGATAVPISGGNTRRQLMMMKDLGATMLACTPSYALYLAEAMAESGIPREEFKLQYGVMGAEPCTEAMRQEIEKKWDIRVTDIYGLTEIIGPGVATECECQCGLHIHEDHFLPEIIDPVTLKPLPYGEEGELVFSTVTKEAVPMMRYRTRDITRLNPETCACGRTFVRMDKVLGRSDDMLIIRGVNVFPSQIETVLVEMGEVEPHYMIIVKREGSLDTLTVQVELSPEAFSDEVRRLEELRGRIARKIQEVLGVSVTVQLVEPKSLPRSEGKAKRVQDLRSKA